MNSKQNLLIFFKFQFIYAFVNVMMKAVATQQGSIKNCLIEVLGGWMR